MIYGGITSRAAIGYASLFLECVMKNQRKIIHVSNSHVALRTAAFVLALVLGVAAISVGITSIGKKEPGYYDIETTPSDEAPLYASGFQLVYWLEGESSDIKHQLNTLKDLYSTALERSYKLVDPETTYEGYVNLASLNASLGQEMEVSGELYHILTDAWEKTRQQRGFNLFAGALQGEWSSILSLTDMEDFDPATNPDVADRLSALAEKTGDLSQFDLKVTDEARHMLQITVDGGYTAFLREKEYCQTVLSLGLMEDAYRLELVRDALEERGYTNGYLSTDSGLTLSLSGHGEGAFGFYGYDGTGPLQYAALAAAPNGVCSYVRSFPMEEGEILYHHIRDEAGERFYHPNFVTATGGMAHVLTTAAAVRYDGDVVGCAYETLCLYNLETREAVCQEAAGDVTLVCQFRDDPAGTMYTNLPDAVTPADGVKRLTF